MKSRSAIFSLLLLLFMGMLFGCGSPKYVVTPEGTVPKRNQLEEDVFGGYIMVKTKDSLDISGELIGMRNDSVFIFSDSISVVHRERISKARVIVHMPNNYKGAGLALMGLSSLVIVHSGSQFGTLPAAVAIGGILYNGIGLASAVGTEEKKINYYDWSEGWEKVIRYSRFPYGIPSTIELSELKVRSK